MEEKLKEVEERINKKMKRLERELEGVGKRIEKEVNKLVGSGDKDDSEKKSSNRGAGLFWGMVFLGVGVVWLAVLGMIPAALVASQPDFAGGMYILIVMVTVLFLAESRFKDMLVLFLLMLAMASVVVFSSEYRRVRLVSWFSPGDAAQASTYQPEQACIALGSGGIMGRGVGRGRQQRGFLPEAFHSR